MCHEMVCMHEFASESDSLRVSFDCVHIFVSETKTRTRAQTRAQEQSRTHSRARTHARHMQSARKRVEGQEHLGEVGR